MRLTPFENRFAITAATRHGLQHSSAPRRGSAAHGPGRWPTQGRCGAVGACRPAPAEPAHARSRAPSGTRGAVGDHRPFLLLIPSAQQYVPRASSEPTNRATRSSPRRQVWARPSDAAEADQVPSTRRVRGRRCWPPFPASAAGCINTSIISCWSPARIEQPPHAVLTNSPRFGHPNADVSFCATPRGCRPDPRARRLHSCGQRAGRRVQRSRLSRAVKETRPARPIGATTTPG